MLKITPTGVRGAALGAVAACVLALAPSLSAGPQPRPGPAPVRDFEQRLDDVTRVAGPVLREVGHGDEGPVTHRSAVLDAPARFDLAGIAGELRHYELRAREPDGEWTEWIEVGNGDPVWFGGAERLQVRTRGWRPEGTVHYVSVARGTTAGDPPRPPIVTREEWGAERRRGGCKPRRKPDYGGVRSVVVHHTVSSNKYSRADAPAMVLAICRFHKRGNGWDDIGYNALVDRFGRVYEGRDGGLGRAVVGAHAQGFNSQTSGVASLGTHTKQPLSRPAMRAAADFIAWKLARHNKTASGRTTLVSAGGSASRYDKGERVRVRKIIGHRRVGLTECPGRELNRQIDRLLRKVRRRMGDSGTDGDGGTGTGGTTP